MRVCSIWSKIYWSHYNFLTNNTYVINLWKWMMNREHRFCSLKRKENISECFKHLVFSDQHPRWRRTSLGTTSYDVACWTALEGTLSDLSRGIQRTEHCCSILVPTLKEIHKWHPILCAKYRFSAKHNFLATDVIQVSLNKFFFSHYTTDHVW